MNEVILLKDKRFKVYIDHDTIVSRVKELCAEMKSTYVGKRPLFIAVLNGSFMIASDVMKYVEFDSEISFVRLKSYHGTESSGDVQTLVGLDEDISGRHVIILEDIVDSGLTLSSFTKDLKKLNPASLEIMSLLLKPDNVQGDLNPKYVGFKIPNKFVVGYGMDYDGYGRNLKDVYQVI